MLEHVLKVCSAKLHEECLPLKGSATGPTLGAAVPCKCRYSTVELSKQSRALAPNQALLETFWDGTSPGVSRIKRLCVCTKSALNLY